jgi:hypothetical protein
MEYLVADPLSLIVNDRKKTNNSILILPNSTQQYLYKIISDGQYDTFGSKFTSKQNTFGKELFPKRPSSTCVFNEKTLFQNHIFYLFFLLDPLITDCSLEYTDTYYFAYQNNKANHFLDHSCETVKILKYIWLYGYNAITHNINSWHFEQRSQSGQKHDRNRRYNHKICIDKE